MAARVDKNSTRQALRSISLVILILFWTSIYFANRIPGLAVPYSRGRISDIFVIVAVLLLIWMLIRQKASLPLNNLFTRGMKWIWISFALWAALALIYTAIYGGVFELATRFGGYLGYFALPVCIALLTRPPTEKVLLLALTSLLQAGIVTNSVAYFLVYNGNSLRHWELRGFTENPNIAAAWFSGLSLIIYLAGATSESRRFRTYQLIVVTQGVVFVGLLSGQAWILGVSLSLVFGPLLLPLKRSRRFRLSLGGFALVSVMTILPGSLVQMSIGNSPQLSLSISQTLDVREPPREIFPALDGLLNTNPDSDTRLGNAEKSNSFSSPGVANPDSDTRLGNAEKSNSFSSPGVAETGVQTVTEAFTVLEQVPLPSGLKERFRFWIIGLQNWQEYPLGVGFDRAYVSDSRFPGGSGGEFHSEAITQVAALGPLGLLLWVAVLVSIWVAGNGVTRALLIGAIPVLVSDNSMSNRTLWLVLATGFLYEQAALRSREPDPRNIGRGSIQAEI